MDSRPQRVVGIDLGTTYSVVAAVTEAGQAVVLRNREGQTTTPSVVLFDPDEPEPLVGEEAQSLAAAMPDHVVEGVKRQMGTPTEWVFHGRTFTSADISGLIVKKLRDDAEHALGQPVRQAVVTVPAYFAHDEREATHRAAELAGLEVLQIINEPTAAALAYRLERSAEPQTVLAYDLGGGTFDVTLMRITTDGVKVITTDGDVQLGGKDWDALLLDHVADAFLAAKGVDPRDDDAYQTLVVATEAAKRSLTPRNKVSIPCRVGNHHMHVPVTREKFEEMSRPLVQRTQDTVEIVLERAGKTREQVDRVLLVGGSTRMPMIRAMLERQFPGKLDCTIHPDECVAVGAAILAARLTAAKLPPSARAKLPARHRELMALRVQDVTAHSLGTATVKERVLTSSIIIPKDSPIPAEEKRSDYTTTYDRQVSLIVPVLQGESRDPRANQLLGCHEFKGIPARPARESPLEVTFRYDASGLARVEARDLKSGQALERADFPLASLDELVRSRAEPLAVVLALDISWSMEGEPLRHAKQGAVEFIRKLADAGGDTDRPQVGIVVFGSGARAIAPLGADPDSMCAGIQPLRVEGTTPMGEALALAYDMIRQEVGRRVIVLLTDGVPDSREHAEEAAATARDDGIVVVALACPGADEAFLACICTPGTDVRTVTDTSQLRREFGDLASELSSDRKLRAM